MEQPIPRGAPTLGEPQLYFAYGSNLSIKQMATRCPESQYIGRAFLEDYAWHINERGYANIIPCPGNSVHGLLYKLSYTDEQRLDRSEGVAFGCYEKWSVTVTLHEAHPSLQVQTAELVANGIARYLPQQEHEGRAQSQVLVYSSERYSRLGEPHYEYIVRMNRAIPDAMALGVPAGYVEVVLHTAMIWRSILTPRAVSFRSSTGSRI